MIYLPSLIFQPGNHIDVRLTSQNGYQTQRSYSISSHPEKKSFFEITVELIEDGEVSPYFFNEIIEGDKIEFRGPVGGPFKWTPQMGGPLLLLAGGSGIAPLRSMMKQNVHGNHNQKIPISIAYSCRTKSDMIYSYEIDHHIPLFKGGTNDISNLQALCRNCHGRKTINDKLNI